MKRLKVFISSTMNNLRSEREALRIVIAELGHEPVMAELFGARNDSPRAACREEVHDSDMIVLLLGDSYGWITPQGSSATEEEFDVAESVHKPLLIYRKIGELFPPSMPPEVIEKYRQFIARVEHYSNGRMRDTFENAFDLQPKARRAIVAVMGEILSSVVEQDEPDGLLSLGLSARFLGYRKLSPGLVAAVRESVQVARKAHHGFIGAPHLLAAIASRPDSILARFLRAHRRSNEETRAAILNQIGASGQPREGPLRPSSGWEDIFKNAADQAGRGMSLEITERHVLKAIFDLRAELIARVGADLEVDLLELDPALRLQPTPYKKRVLPSTPATQKSAMDGED